MAFLPLVIQAVFRVALLYLAWRAIRANVTSDKPDPDALKPFDHADVFSPMWQTPKARIASLEERDPQFSELRFLERASAAYLAALRAEAAMAPALLAALATQRYRDDLAHCVAYWRSEGLTRHISDVGITSCAIIGGFAGSEQQRIILRLSGTWVHFTARTSDHVLVDGSAQRQSFTKFAIFVRPRDATTPAPLANAPAHCPGCGAPVEPGAAVCGSCGRPLAGQDGWLLDRVTNTPYV